MRISMRPRKLRAFSCTPGTASAARREGEEGSWTPTRPLLGFVADVKMVLRFVQWVRPEVYHQPNSRPLVHAIEPSLSMASGTSHSQ